jgi:leucyl aminopeptidase
MKVSVVGQPAKQVSADLLALPVFELPEKGWKLPSGAVGIDRALSGALGAAVAAGDFRGKRGQSHLVYGDGRVGARRVLLVGLGKEEKLDAETVRNTAGEAVRATTRCRGTRAAVLAPRAKALPPTEMAQALAEGAVLGSYAFDRYQTLSAKENGNKPAKACALVFEQGKTLSKLRESARTGAIVGECQNVARDLSNEPGGELPPAALAREAGRFAREAGLEFKALGVAELRKRKMGGILAVGEGSSRPPRLIILEHGRRSRGGKGRPTVVLVGKGITFDSGGISIKPGAAMDEMKHDMSGAAAVVGAMRAVGLLKLPLHVVGLIPAAENLPSGTAYRPGDVVETSAGTTIEVLNTDAEGRVVLSDALHFGRTAFKPAAMVDLATLTGAAVIALGPWATAMMGNDEKLAERIRQAGEASGERVWPLPLWEEHREYIRSQVADIKNTGGREGGSITAAAFLSYFTEGTPWVHLDIAATAWTKKATPTQPFGATGVGVRLLVEFLRHYRKARR